MYQMDPKQLILMIKQGYNPQQLMLNFLEANMGHTPMGQNLLTLAKNGRTDEIERIARNLAAQQGRDFDKEFKAFKDRLGFK